jgi:hypothetical protein
VRDSHTRLPALQDSAFRIEERLGALENLAERLANRGADRGTQTIAKDLLRFFEREHGTMHDLWSALRGGLEGVAHGQARLDVEQVARFSWSCRRHLYRPQPAVLRFAT